MISWRYHLISIVAVFLALALGVLAGTTVINDSLVNDLRSRTSQLQRDLAARNGQLDQSTKQADQFQTYADEAFPFLAANRLVGRDVLVVTQTGVDAATLNNVDEALGLSGAKVVNTLIVRPTIAAATTGDQKTLAADLGASPQTAAAQLPRLAAEMIATRLHDGAPSTIRPNQEDLLAGLLSDGFLDTSAPVSDTAAIGGAGQLVIVIGGGASDTIPPPAGFLVPLTAQLTRSGTTTLAGEAKPTPDGFVLQVRSTVTEGEGPLVTVDDLANSMGGGALVLGLQRAADQGVGGNYGIDRESGATLLPPPP